MQPPPRLLLTRPRPDSARLLAALPERLTIDAIVSPLIEIVPEGRALDPRDLAGVAGLVLTSANALAALGPADLPRGLRAWCVGDRTAEAARNRGLDAKSAEGDAEALIALILSERPQGGLLHLHGAHVRGDVSARLTEAGVPCRSRIVYSQQERPLTSEARAALGGGRAVIVPLYSPRTARLLAGAGPFAAPVHVVALSDATARAAVPLGPRTSTVAARPDQAAMRDALVRLHAGST